MTIQLAVGTAPANSPDVVIAPGSSLAVYLVPPTGIAIDPFNVAAYSIAIDRKSDGGDYNEILKLSDQMRALILYGAGTFRFRREQQDQPVGVETEGAGGGV